MADTYTYRIAAGGWRAVLAGPQKAHLTGRDDYDLAYGVAQPPADLDGHVGLARAVVRVTPAEGQAVWVRNRQRDFRLTVTRGIYEVDQPAPNPGPEYVQAGYVEGGYV